MKSDNVIQQKSYAFALRVIKLYRYLCEEKKEFVLSKQLLRCGTSVGANVEEAIGGQSQKDFFAERYYRNPKDNRLHSKNNKISSFVICHYLFVIHHYPFIISKGSAALKVNIEMLTLYWEIGNSIIEKQQQNGWGSKVIDFLAVDLAHNFPENKGFSVRNLKYMRTFAAAYPQFPIVQVPLAQPGEYISKKR